MEGKGNGSVNGHQALETELNEMLQNVVLPENSEENEQCIYIVPQEIRQVNPKAYTPQVVSIGPFHKPRGSSDHDDLFLLPMEELKVKYLKGFLDRTPQLCVGDFVHKLEELETRIRSCYAGPINYNSSYFLKMVLIDACFIIELFLRCRKFNDWRRNTYGENQKQDPILSKPWLAHNIRRDLILLENQLPFFVLEDMYNLAGMNHDEFSSFLHITLLYFRYHIKQSINCESVHPKHFTDLLRTFMIPPSFDDERTEEGVINHVYSASQLKDAGSKFKVSVENKCLLDIEFDKQKGVLTMPCFEVHDFTEIYMRNIVAFEQCHLPFSLYVTQYCTFLDFLINKENDVNTLIDKKIIVNYMGDANEAATMVNNLLRNVLTPYFNSRYLCLCNDLNRFYENPRNKYKAIFIHDYFNTPWKIASTIAAVLLLLLTLIQTICSIISLSKQ